MKKEISRHLNGKRVITKKPELLAPAGNLEKLKTAVLYGADAVFIGGKEFSLRSLASNFTLEDIKEAVEFAHAHGSKVHITTNIVMHENNLEGLEDYLQALDEAGVDAIIAADPHIILTAKRLGCRFETHVSTQLSSMNSQTVNFWANLGAERVVLAREVTYEDLCTIVDKSPVEIEYFIHGAMCINLSGRCMLSNHYSKRDANRGGCSQSCRWFYQLEDMNGNSLSEQPFTMSSKDLCSIREIPKLIEAGVDSFKIEGRMKSIHYIATIVSTYRKLIDAYCEDPDNFEFDEFYSKELEKAANRQTSTGFFYGTATHHQQLFNLRDEHPTQEFVIRVLDFNEETMMAKIEQRNYFKVGQTVEFFSPNQPNFEMEITEIYNEKMEAVDVANHPMETLYIKMSQVVSANDMARKVK